MGKNHICGDSQRQKKPVDVGPIVEFINETKRVVMDIDRRIRALEEKQEFIEAT